MLPFIFKTTPAKIVRTGDKYLLAPNGDLYHVSEHAFGARSLAANTLNMADLESIGIDPNHIPPTFGVTEMYKLGWLRLNTFSDIIGVTWRPGPLDPTDPQENILREMRDRYDAINGRKSAQILKGDGPVSEGRDAVDL